jgi:VanZ family protein
MFFILSHAQVRARGAQGFRWAAAATLVMGAVLEMAQALTGSGHCRVRDLIPDTVGAVLGMFLVLLWQRVTTQITATSPTPRAP